MIYLLCGMIASGKTTYANKLAKEKQAVIINDDDIVKMLHGDYTQYRTELKPLYKSIETHILTSGVLAGLDIVVDRGVNVRASSRRRWIELAKSLDVPITCIVFPVDSPAEHSYRRWSHDPRGHSLEYWDRVAEAHWKDYVSPNKDEGFIEIGETR